MKLLIISPQPEHSPVDAFRVFRALGEELSKRGHTVDYYIEPGKPSPVNSAGKAPYSAIGRGLRIATGLTRTCRKRDYDFLLTAASLGWCLSTFRRWLLPGHTKVLSWHGGHVALLGAANGHPETSEARPELSQNGHWRERLAYWAGKKALQTQDGYFFNATEAPVQILANHPEAEQQKLLYLPNGVANHYYFPERHQPPNDRKPPSLLLMVGPWTGANLKLVETFSRLHRVHPQLRLTVAKAGLSAAQVLADFPPEVRAAVHVQERLNEPELVSTYQQHDIYLQPTPGEGGLPLSLLEAMAAAMPVVADEAPGVRDVLKHYENGLLVPPQDGTALEQSITHLLESPDLYRTLGESAYDHVTRYYTWRQVSDIFEEKLFQILEDRLTGIPLPF